MQNRIIIGNWKMNPISSADAKKIFTGIRDASAKLKKTKAVLCPPFVYLENLSKLSNAKVSLGAQDVFWELEGAYTGEISPKMLQKFGVTHVIVGHSERRALGQTNESVNKKVKACIKFGLTPVLCIGESVRDEEAQYLTFVRQQIKECLAGITKEQLKKVIVAYEPVWAIGKKALRQATVEESLEMSIFIKKVLSDMFKIKNGPRIKIIYGGSVNAENARNFLINGGISGLLVGRDSLTPEKFISILKEAEKLP